MVMFPLKVYEPWLEPWGYFSKGGKTLEFITVFKVNCSYCAKPFYELDNGLLHCPFCGKGTACMVCMNETLVYGIDVNAQTGKVSIIWPDAGREFLS